MQLREHILYGGAVSLLISPIFGFRALFFFLASVLIDVDHYIDFLYFSRFKNWKIKSMFSFHKRMSEMKGDKHLCGLEAFHTIEFLLALLFLAFYFHSTELLLIFCGMVFHLSLDLIRLLQFGKDFIRVRALSFIEYWIRSEKMRRSGIDPEQLFFYGYSSARIESNLVRDNRASNS